MRCRVSLLKKLAASITLAILPHFEATIEMHFIQLKSRERLLQRYKVSKVARADKKLLGSFEAF